MDENKKQVLDSLLAEIESLDRAKEAVVRAFEATINTRVTRLNVFDTAVEFLNYLGHVDAAQRAMKGLVEKARGE